MTTKIQPSAIPSNPPAGDRSVPFEFAIRFWRKNAIYKAIDYWFARAEEAERADNEPRVRLADSRYNALWDELQRRSDLEEQRARRRLERMRAAWDAEQRKTIAR